MMNVNYASPSVYEYQRLVDKEAWLLQVAEFCEARGLHEDARWFRHMKKFVFIRRKCMKAACNKKKNGQCSQH
jgi:hypothetical protein